MYGISITVTGIIWDRMENEKGQITIDGKWYDSWTRTGNELEACHITRTRMAH